jgi:hypothetical protein
VMVQKNIQTLLKAQPEYIVTTSEFDNVKARLTMLERRRKPSPQDDPNRPQLKRAPNLKDGLARGAADSPKLAHSVAAPPESMKSAWQAGF